VFSHFHASEMEPACANAVRAAFVTTSISALIAFRPMERMREKGVDKSALVGVSLPGLS